MNQDEQQNATAAASVAKTTTPPHTPSPYPRWSGGFKPRRTIQIKTLGNLGDDSEIGPIATTNQVDYSMFTPIDVPPPGGGNTGPQYLSPSFSPLAPTPAAPSSTPSLWSSLGNMLSSGLNSYAQTQTTAALQQAQQKALINTWNPALTGPALQAQAYQAAYTTGSAAPMSGTTIALIGAGLLGLFLLGRK